MEAQHTHKQDTAILAGGCFWCLEAVYREVAGVQRVESGYLGGASANPAYEEVCSGRTGHAEAVRIMFDPAQISFRDLLEIFFVIHDPTQFNRQGNDVGTQYRSAIFWLDEAQRDAAQNLIAELTRDAVYASPIVTRIEPAGTFYRAEQYHQDYYRQHANQPYCAIVISPKLEKFRRHFARLTR